LLDRSWCEENSWKEAEPEHVSPRTPQL